MTIFDRNKSLLDVYGLERINQILEDDVKQLNEEFGYVGSSVLSLNFIKQDKDFAGLVVYFNDFGIGVCPYYYSPDFDSDVPVYGFTSKWTPNIIYINVLSKSIVASGIHEFIHIIKIINLGLYLALLKSSYSLNLYKSYLTAETKASLIDSEYEKPVWSDELFADFFIKKTEAMHSLKQVLYDSIHKKTNTSQFTDPEQLQIYDLFIDLLKKFKIEEYNPFIKQPNQILSYDNMTILLYLKPLSTKIICKECTNIHDFQINVVIPCPLSCGNCGTHFDDNMINILNEMRFIYKKILK